MSCYYPRNFMKESKKWGYRYYGQAYVQKKLSSRHLYKTFDSHIA
jgi:hypothetical protein